MYVGILNQDKKFTYTYADSPIAFPPTSEENGVPMWSWKVLRKTAIDLTTELGRECYVGAVNVKLDDRSVAAVEVLVDGALCGAYHAETGKLCGGDINVPVGSKGSTVTLRLYGEFADINLYSLDILGAYDDEKPLVWPTPKNIKALGGYVKIKEIVAASDDADETFAAEFLNERLTEKLGEYSGCRGVTVVFEKDSSYKNERYTVECTDKKVIIKAASRLTLLYGSDSVLQLTDKNGFFRADINDAPACEIRGFHMGLPHRGQFEFVKRLFRYVLLPMRFNMLVVAFAGGMRFDKHPKIAEAWMRSIENSNKGLQPPMPHSNMVAGQSVLEKDEVRLFLSYARELGIEVVPEIQSLGHVQYITYAYPEIAEIDENKNISEDERNADPRPSAFYEHCYCPSLPRSMEIIHDIFDEIVEVVQPERYVHIGHDEVYTVGGCPRCKDKDPADIFADHVKDLYNYAATKGYKIMMWSDMLQDPKIRKYAVNTHRAIDKLPKDILMLDFVWYFATDKDIEDKLLAHGFELAVGNLYSPNYPRFEQRMYKKGMRGGVLSTWHVMKEKEMGLCGKFFDTMYLGEMLWDRTYDSRNRSTYNHILSKYIQPGVRDLVRGVYNVKGYSCENIAMPSGDASAVPAELKALCKKAVVLDNASVEVGKKYDRIVFEHTTVRDMPAREWFKYDTVGTYTVTYDDGAEEKIELGYAKHVMRYTEAYGKPMLQKVYRHTALSMTWHTDPVFEAKNDRGEDVCVCGLVWENPHPEKTVAKIGYERDEKEFAKLVLVGIKGFNKKN